jgi:hypothetical protein
VLVPVLVAVLRRERCSARAVAGCGVLKQCLIVVGCACCGGAGPTPEASAAICSGFRVPDTARCRGTCRPGSGTGAQNGWQKAGRSRGGRTGGHRRGGPMVPEVRMWRNRAANVRASRARPPARADRQNRAITARRRTPGETSLAAGVYCTVLREVVLCGFCRGGPQSGVPAAAPGLGYLSQKETGGFAGLKWCGKTCLCCRGRRLARSGRRFQPGAKHKGGRNCIGLI